MLFRSICAANCSGVLGITMDPAVRKRIEDTGSIVMPSTPEQFAAQMATELAIYKKVVETQKLTLE